MSTVVCVDVVGASGLVGVPFLRVLTSYAHLTLGGFRSCVLLPTRSHVDFLLLCGDGELAILTNDQYVVLDQYACERLVGGSFNEAHAEHLADCTESGIRHDRIEHFSGGLAHEDFPKDVRGVSL